MCIRVRELFSFGRKFDLIKIRLNTPLTKSSVLRFGLWEDRDFWNQDVKSTLLVEQRGVEPLNPDLIGTLTPWLGP